MSDNPPDSPQIFHCPNCGAALPDPDAASVICRYCGTRILVPPEYQPKGKMAGPAALPAAAQSGSSPRSSLLLTFLLAAVFTLVLIGVIALLRGAPGRKTASQGLAAPAAQVQQPFPSPSPVEIETLTPVPTPFASLLLQFGGQGSGAGQFDDSRFIDVDRDGNIYAADYTDGRVQKFDPSGKFLWLVNIPPKEGGSTTIRDLAVGMDGTVYVLRSPDILVYHPDGSPAATLSGNPPAAYYDALDIDPANTLYALHSFADLTSLVKLSPQGEVLLRTDDLDSQLGKHFTLSSVRLAVDGLGNSYLLNGSGDALYLFDANGQFRDILASKGEAPGQLNFPMNVAVGGDGRIYLINNSQIQVLDSNGAFLNGFDIDYSNGSPFDLTLDLQGNLYLITSSGHISKYRVNLKE
jgi:DNA-binding beta-propeller fold protein YncE/DNA-directed RNA polymerase subunit RPC12/RpoP